MDPQRVASFFEVLYTTRALRRLKPDPVPDAVLFQLIDAAIRAPSGQSAQDWRFILVTDPALKRDMEAAATEA
jgi:nitroreductase